MSRKCTQLYNWRPHRKVIVISCMRSLLIFFFFGVFSTIVWVGFENQTNTLVLGLGHPCCEAAMWSDPPPIILHEKGLLQIDQTSKAKPNSIHSRILSHCTCFSVFFEIILVIQFSRDKCVSDSQPPVVSLFFSCERTIGLH